MDNNNNTLYILDSEQYTKRLLALRFHVFPKTKQNKKKKNNSKRVAHTL